MALVLCFWGRLQLANSQQMTSQNHRYKRGTSHGACTPSPCHFCVDGGFAHCISAAWPCPCPAIALLAVPAILPTAIAP